MIEEWKSIDGYEGLYEVSNLGRVKSLMRYDNLGHLRKEKFLKPADDEHGYQHVKLSKDGKPKWFSVHRLVASAFLEKPVDTNKTQVNHKDENKTNNVLVLNADGSVNVEQSNLEWVTPKENSNHGTRKERIAKSASILHKGVYNTKHSKRVIQYSNKNEVIREWQSTMEVHRMLGIHHSDIIQCCLGKRKSAGGYIWKYA